MYKFNMSAADTQCMLLNDLVTTEATDFKRIN